MFSIESGVFGVKCNLTKEGMMFVALDENLLGYTLGIQVF